MPEFEVGSERQRLRHSDVAPSLEHHHGDWTTRQGVPDNEFGYNVQPDLLVCDRLDHADWYCVEECCNN